MLQKISHVIFCLTLKNSKIEAANCKRFLASSRPKPSFLIFQKPNLQFLKSGFYIRKYVFLTSMQMYALALKQEQTTSSCKLWCRKSRPVRNRRVQQFQGIASRRNSLLEATLECCLKRTAEILKRIWPLHFLWFDDKLSFQTKTCMNNEFSSSLGIIYFLHNSCAPAFCKPSYPAIMNICFAWIVKNSCLNNGLNLTT